MIELTSKNRKTFSYAIGTLIVLLGPALLFPQIVPPSVRKIAVPSATVFSFALATLLLRRWAAIAISSAIVGITALVGWLSFSNSAASLSHFAGLGLGLLLLGILSNWCDHSKRIESATIVFLLGSLAVLGIAMTTMDTPEEKIFALPIVNRLPHLKLPLEGLESSGLVNANAPAGAAVLIAPIAMAALLLPRKGGRSRFFLRIVGGLTALVSGAVIVVTQCRTAWIALWLLVMVWCLSLHTKLKVRICLLVLVLAIPVIAFAHNRTWLTRFQFSRVEPYASPIDDRLLIMRGGIQILSTSPWLGIGISEFRNVYKPKIDTSRPQATMEPNAHNIFIQTALDLGIIGFGAYMCLMAAVLVFCWQVTRGENATLSRIAMGAGLSIVGAHAFGLGDAIALGAKLGTLQWFAAGLVLGACRAQVASPESSRRTD